MIVNDMAAVDVDAGLVIADGKKASRDDKLVVMPNGFNRVSNVKCERQSSEKYKNPPQAPPTFTGTKASIVNDVKALCYTTWSLLDKVVAEVPAENPIFASVMAPKHCHSHTKN
ncbi:Uu.00g134820.m01.CDS01 [Anthostomella pinea]|uniref:Uu.00g134820.m01.CDS01 n=1 Tax=Anthostomella pinea TaxID=933095 RepID=A0AAI8VQ67_9PEZI|nr:Uu.00g134820.m01.CDS01 [Anthostomella pinea]